MHFSRAEIEGHAIERAKSCEGLADVASVEKQSRHELIKRRPPFAARRRFGATAGAGRRAGWMLPQPTTGIARFGVAHFRTRNR